MVKDPRTNLPGRDSFYRHVPPLLKTVSSLILLSTEIEGLGFVLRTFGPDGRDKVVSEIGLRIKNAAGDHHTLFHISQDCFALPLLAGGYQQATTLATTIYSILKEPFDIDGIAYHLGAHVGISHFPNHARSINELVRTSAFACQLARENRSGCATFDSKLDERERERFRLMVDLETALNQHAGIHLVYQPIVNLASGKCSAAEGLCRWQHPELGTIFPGKFLPYVEQTSLILPLTESTLGVGLAALSQWQSKGFDGTLAINLSPRLFRHADLLDRLQEQFRFANVSPERIHFEITETGMMEQQGTAINTLKALRGWGSKIAVDDFGTGHSSLAYLADLPIDSIKIDKHFIQNLSLPWGEAIVGATAVLADKLGLTTVAEGIETGDEYRKCRDLGVTCGQGYYLARPMPQLEFERWAKSAQHV